MPEPPAPSLAPKTKWLSSCQAELHFCGGDGTSSPMPKPQSPSEKKRREAEKAERLAEQLRANLRRRKAQSRTLDTGKTRDPSDNQT